MLVTSLEPEHLAEHVVGEIRPSIPVKPGQRRGVTGEFAAKFRDVRGVKREVEVAEGDDLAARPIAPPFHQASDIVVVQSHQCSRAGPPGQHANLRASAR